MIDTHCHIDFDEFEEDRDDVIARAKEKLSAVINSGYGLESNAKALALSKEYEGFVYPRFWLFQRNMKDSFILPLAFIRFHHRILLRKK